MAAISTCMRAGDRRIQFPKGDMVRLLTPEQRLSIALYRISPLFPPDNFVCVSVDATLFYVGGGSWGPGVFPFRHNRIYGIGTRIIRRRTPNRGMRVDGRGYRCHLLAPQGVPEYTDVYRKSECAFLGIPSAFPIPITQPSDATFMSVLSDLLGGYPPRLH